MKTYLGYGALLTLASFLFTLILFILGLHSDPEKLKLAQGIGTIGGLVIGLGVTIAGVRAVRSKSPASESFTYGSAFGAGAAIAVIAGFLNMITHYVYITVINPQFTDVIVQAQLNKLAARGISGDQFDRAERMIRMTTGPVWQVVFVCIGSCISGLIVALIAAAFLRRPAAPPSLGNSP